MDDNCEVVEEIYNAIAHYVARQAAVLRIMLDLGLDPEVVGKWGALTWEWRGAAKAHSAFALNSGLESELREVVRGAQMRKVSQKGLQGHWQYYLHGNGCTIKHKKTGEPISWDCPNPKAFDPYAFVEHLEWRIRSNQGIDALAKISELYWATSSSQFVLDAIFSMKEMELITADWTLAAVDAR